jgi:hypothetical protein
MHELANQAPDGGHSAPVEFRELAPGELMLSSDSQSRDTWQLRQDDAIVGTILRSSGETGVAGRSGRWQVTRSERQLRTSLNFRPIGMDAPSASYQPRFVLPGGQLVLSDERFFELRPPGVFGKAWKVSDKTAGEFTQVTISSQGWPAREWVFHLDREAASQPSALLVVLATAYVIVADQARRPLSTG